MLGPTEIHDREGRSTRYIVVEHQFDAFGVTAEHREIETVVAVLDAER
jgi:hypothetical protein